VGSNLNEEPSNSMDRAPEENKLLQNLIENTPAIFLPIFLWEPLYRSPSL